MEIFPSLTSSSPATRRSSVDLPQPDGPSSTTNFPAGARKLTRSTALTVPKRLVTFSRTISDKLSALEPAGLHQRPRPHGAQHGDQAVGKHLDARVVEGGVVVEIAAREGDAIFRDH